jgi:hypothetical protein
MEELIQKLTQLLQQNFEGGEVEFETTGTQRVGGVLIWEGFTGLQQIERQRRVWEVIRNALAPDEQLQVAALLTLTPEEMSSARAD